MTALFEIETFERDNTISPRKLRSIGYVPATVDGKGREPQSVQFNTHDLTQALMAGNRQFKLKGYVQADAQVKQIQKVSTREELLHAEFHVVSA